LEGAGGWEDGSLGEDEGLVGEKALGGIEVVGSVNLLEGSEGME
jgi:hypothetical protein